MTVDSNKGFNLMSAGDYRIIVQGHLEPSYGERLAGMQITHERLEDGSDATVLVGRLRDQAQLSGVLDFLYNLRLPVVSVDLLRARSESIRRS